MEEIIAVLFLVYFLIGTLLMIIFEFSPYLRLHITDKNTGEELTGFKRIYLNLCIYYAWIIIIPLIWIQNGKN